MGKLCVFKRNVIFVLQTELFSEQQKLYAYLLYNAEHCNETNGPEYHFQRQLWEDQHPYRYATRRASDKKKSAEKIKWVEAKVCNATATVKTSCLQQSISVRKTDLY